MPIGQCHYHRGPIQDVCPLGGKCETEEEWGLPASGTITQLRARVAGLEGAQEDLIEVTSRTIANLVIENAELRRGFQVTGDVEALMRLEEK